MNRDELNRRKVINRKLQAAFDALCSSEKALKQKIREIESRLKKDNSQ